MSEAHLSPTDPPPSGPPPSGPLVLGAIGEAAILCETADPWTMESQQRFWGLAEQVETWPETRDYVIGVNNLMIVFDPVAVAASVIRRRLVAAWDSGCSAVREARIFEIPVEYGGAAGIDLAEMAAARGISPAELAHDHAAAAYIVSAVAGPPGLAHLAGLNPALAQPRRTVPRISVAAGSVIIGGQQTGILPVTGPTGWNVIGRTRIPVFEPRRSAPALLQPGDRVRFVVEAVHAD